MKYYCSIFLSLTTLLTLSEGKQEQEQSYFPGNAEQYVIDAKNFGSSKGCLIWDKGSPLDDQMKTDLDVFKHSLIHYTKRRFEKADFAPDVRKLFNDDYSNQEEVCKQFSDPLPYQEEPAAVAHAAEMKKRNHLDPKTVEIKHNLRGSSNNESNSNPIVEYFNGSAELSFSTKYGYMEPLVPPLHHPEMCPRNYTDRDLFYIVSLDHLIEDFGHICRHAMKKNTRNVFFDLGATYNFKKAEIDQTSPAIKEIETYRQHGIHFDHIYAYELRKWDTDMVYKTIPKHMKQPLHWINTAVNAEVGNEHNPWTMLMDHFDKDDFVVVKLDIDTASIELPLAQQLLTDTRLHELVDVFYFEHHVLMDEMKNLWDLKATAGSIAESLDLFQNLRKAGIAAHYWI